MELLLQFASIERSRTQRNRYHTALLLRPLRATPYRCSPTITSWFRSTLVIAVASFLFPSYRALRSVPVPVLLPVPESASAIAPVPLPTNRPASFHCRDDDDYTVLCCAVLCVLARASCSHLTAPICNAAHGRPLHVTLIPPSPSRSSRGCRAHNSTTRQGTLQHHNPATFGVILCYRSRKPSRGVSLATRHRAPQLARHRHLERQQSPRSDGPTCSAQPASGFS